VLTSILVLKIKLALVPFLTIYHRNAACLKVEQAYLVDGDVVTFGGVHPNLQAGEEASSPQSELTYIFTTATEVGLRK